MITCLFSRTYFTCMKNMRVLLILYPYHAAGAQAVYRGYGYRPAMPTPTCRNPPPEQGTDFPVFRQPAQIHSYPGCLFVFHAVRRDKIHFSPDNIYLVSRRG